jgi:hypothetical protein
VTLTPVVVVGADLDVQGDMIGAVMQSSTAGSTPVDAVDALIGEVADEAGIDMQAKFPEMALGQPEGQQAAQAAASSQEVRSPSVFRGDRACCCPLFADRSERLDLLLCGAQDELQRRLEALK